MADSRDVHDMEAVSTFCCSIHIAVTKQYLHASKKKLEEAMLADPLAVGV